MKNYERLEARLTKARDKIQVRATINDAQRQFKRGLLSIEDFTLLCEMELDKYLELEGVK